MAEDGDDDDSEGTSLVPVRRFVRFRPEVSFGNLLIVVGMMASVGVTLLVSGREIQAVVDSVSQEHNDLVHEVEMRQQGEKNEANARLQSEQAIVAQITAMTTQESRDVSGINQTLQDIRADYRELLHIAGPSSSSPPYGKRN